MEVLTSKLAELLQVGVDGATKAYPVLREQYIWYRVMENIIVTAGIVFFIGLVAAGGAGLANLLTYAQDDEFDEKMSKIYKTLGVVCLVSLIILVTAATLRVVLAPDIMMILEML